MRSRCRCRTPRRGSRRSNNGRRLPRRQRAIGINTARGGPVFGSGVGLPLPTGPCRPKNERSSAVNRPPGGHRDEKDGAALVAQSYNVFRFLMACQSRGRIQTKFNGGLFTQQLRVRGGQWPARRGETGRRHVAHARGRQALGPPVHVSEPAIAVLAAAGQRGLRSDEAVFRLLLEAAADAQRRSPWPGSGTKGPITARILSRPAPSATAITGESRPRPSRARNTRDGITIIISPAASKPWR